MAKKKTTNEELPLSEQDAALMQYLVKKGLIADETIADAESRARKQKIARQTYHNTELMLQSYRDIVWTLETYPQQLDEELELGMKDLDYMLEKVDLELATSNERLLSRMHSVAKSRVLIDRLNEAITLLRSKPKDGEDMYRVIRASYIDEPDDSIYETFERLGMSKRRYYNLRRRAIGIISFRLWSVPDSQIEMWMEIVSILGGTDT